jgi:hypothetical protein
MYDTVAEVTNRWDGRTCVDFHHHGSVHAGQPMPQLGGLLSSKHCATSANLPAAESTLQANPHKIPRDESASCVSLWLACKTDILALRIRIQRHRNDRMQPSRPTKSNWASPDAGYWYRWRGYTVRWLLLGGVTGMFQPIADELGSYWLHRLHELLLGLFFGAVCAVVFTLAENTLNVPRINWKSWSIVIATWLAVKLVFVSVMAAAG